jgi:hypothetical protein
LISISSLCVWCFDLNEVKVTGEESLDLLVAPLMAIDKGFFQLRKHEGLGKQASELLGFCCLVKLGHEENSLCRVPVGSHSVIAGEQWRTVQVRPRRNIQTP